MNGRLKTNREFTSSNLLTTKGSLPTEMLEKMAYYMASYISGLPSGPSTFSVTTVPADYNLANQIDNVNGGIVPTQKTKAGHRKYMWKVPDKSPHGDGLHVAGPSTTQKLLGTCRIAVSLTQ